jgi:hypothetical protein
MFNDSLYLRLSWSDPTHSVWRDHYELTEIEPTFVRFFHYCCDDNSLHREDQLVMMFEGLADDGWDTWNWRSLTTGSAGLAENMVFRNGSFDTLEVAVYPAYLNPEQLNGQPKYMHVDSSDFTGFVLHETDTARTDLTPGGWGFGDIIPGWIVDTSVASLPASTRGARWPIRAASTHVDSANLYTVVLCRAMNTTYTDNLNMAALDSVHVKLGLLDNQIAITTGGTGRGFTEEFWLIF